MTTQIAFIGAASESLIPIRSTWGDIQAATNIALGAWQTTRLASDTGVWNGLTEPSFTGFVSKPGLTPLPGIVGGHYFTWNPSVGGSAESLTTSIEGTAVLLRITTDEPITYSREIEIVCPQVHFVSAMGCHSCVPGFAVIVRGVSTCLSGLVLIKSDIGIVTQGVEFSNIEEKDFVLYGTTNSKEVSGPIEFIGKETVSLHVSFTLEDPDDFPPIDDNPDDGRPNDRDGSTIWDAIGRWISKIYQTWWSGLIATLVLIFSIGMAIYLVRFCCGGPFGSRKEKDV
jgi:hypothetical protein